MPADSAREDPGGDALARVLDAEVQAQAKVQAARAEAERIIEKAHRTAQEVVERAERRARILQSRNRDEMARLLAAIEARTAKRLHKLDGGIAADEETIRTAVARVAARLTGANASDTGSARS